MREAAELEHVGAMSLYGSMLLFGHGTKENGREAEKWLIRGAHTGNSDAIALLGMGYATGKAGFPQDMALGRKYLTEAAEKGDEKSREMLRLTGSWAYSPNAFHLDPFEVSWKTCS